MPTPYVIEVYPYTYFAVSFIKEFYWANTHQFITNIFISSIFLSIKVTKWVIYAIKNQTNSKAK